MSDSTKYSQSPLALSLPPRFGPGFLKDHAGKILTDPRIAVVELVANSWDAGADSINISWPESVGGEIRIKDNGVGMSYEQFVNRWRVLSYNRRDEQGGDVNFPPNNMKSSRKAFGRNGKGRHAMFCFSREYKVVVLQNGEKCEFKVTRSDNAEAPFLVELLLRTPGEGNGLELSCLMNYYQLSIPELRELIGSKFVADPSFRIKVNDELIEMTDLENVSETFIVPVDNLRKVTVRHFDSRKTGRTSKQHGVAWWVNKRLVGEASWRGFDQNPYLDARKSEAKRHTFVVEADFLEDSVSPDWDEFIDTEDFQRVSDVVRDFVLGKLQELFSDIQKSRKIEAITQHRDEIKELAPDSRKKVGVFLDEIQKVSPTITQRDLNASVQLLANLEKSKSQYALLKQLANLNPEDLDGLCEILSQWTIGEAKIVLDTLGKRLKLIETMERLVENPTTDELHEIQPLFENGLWIFGPEYESIDFMSNKTLATIIRRFFNDPDVELATPRKRPDIVALPNSTVSVYSSDSFDEASEVDGIRKVLLIELKRGGFTLGRKEKQQALDYANEIRKSGRIKRDTPIVGFVLGAQIEPDALEKSEEGNTTIYSRTYSTILQQAHARTFNLQKRINDLRQAQGYILEETDVEIESVLSQPIQHGIFSDEALKPQEL